MKVYVAGSSTERARAEAFIDKLREHGFTITFDWAAHIVAVGASNEGVSRDERERSAEADLDGVREADWFVLLEPHGTRATIGAWIELGVAIEAMKPVLWVGEGERTIFNVMADATVGNDDHAFYYLLGMRDAKPAEERGAL